MSEDYIRLNDKYCRLTSFPSRSNPDRLVIDCSILSRLDRDQAIQLRDHINKWLGKDICNLNKRVSDALKETMNGAQ